MNATTHPERDRHLRSAAYYALALLAGVIGLSASYVTVQLFALAIQATEQEGTARELLTLTAALFIAAELTAMFVAGLLPVRRLRALRWQLSACAVALVAFEAVSLYGARVALAQTADAHADAGAGRVEQLQASIEANRRSAAALVAAGQRSSQSAIASSRADGAQSIRDAAALEADTRHMVVELAQLQAARAPTTTAVFGEAGVIALAVAQSLLISGIGLLFLGAAGGLARAARDASGTATTDAPQAGAAAPARATALTDAPTTTAADALAPTAAPAAAPAETDALAPMHLTALADAPAAALPAADAPRPLHLAVKQTQAAPKGIPPAVPSWGRYALPASALAAGAGLLMPCTAQAAATDAAPAHADALVTAAPLQPSVAPPAPPDHAAAPTDAPADDDARLLRVKAGIEAGRIKPSIRAIYAAEGASQQVARRYLVELEQAGVIQRAGRGYALRTLTSPVKKGGEA